MLERQPSGMDRAVVSSQSTNDRAASRARTSGVMMLGLAVLSWLMCPRPLPDPIIQGANEEASAARCELASILGAVRFCEARLNGPFAFAPFHGRPASARPSAGLQRVLTRIARAADQGASGASDAAVASLVAGRPRWAVERLERFVSLQTPSSSLLSDLSAAYLELARAANDPYFVFMALATADRALGTADPPVEALFNRALALETLQLHSEARRAWCAYLAHDPESSWATEARARSYKSMTPTSAQRWREAQHDLLRLAAAGDTEGVQRLISDLNPSAAAYVEDLMGKWAEAAELGRATAAQEALSAARNIGRIVAEQGGDLMPSDAVAAIDRCGRCSAARTAHSQFASALVLYRGLRFEAAKGVFTSAIRTFRRYDSPLTFLAQAYSAACDFQRGDYGAASGVLSNLHRRIPHKRYPSMLARVRWLEGLIAGVQGRLSDSLTDFRDAVPLYAAVRDEEKLGGVYALLAENYALIGDSRNTWRCGLRALAALPAMTDPVRSSSMLHELAFAAANAGELATALPFQNEALAFARVTGRPDMVAEALRQRAAILTHLHRWDWAKRDLQQAREQSAVVPDPMERRIVEADILAVEGEQAVATDPSASVVALSAAVSAYEQTRFYLQLSDLYLHRALALEEMRRYSEAEADLESAMVNLERQGAEIDSQPLRLFFLDLSRGLADTAVRLFSERGRALEALAFAERARAQCLLATASRSRSERVNRASFGRSLTHAIPITEIQDRLRPGVAVVEYAVLSDRLVAWFISRSTLRMVVTHLTRRDLRRLVDSLSAALRSSALKAFATESASAFDLLIRPFRADLRGIVAAIVVPDQDLYRVPFGALLDSADGKPLMTWLSTGVAPSAASYIALSERPMGLSGQSELSVLVVGNPTRGRDAVVLSDLPGAQHEAISVAALYPKSRLLLGAAATKRAFRAESSTVDLIHIAAHAATKDESHGEVGILFSPSDESDKPLRSDDLRLGRAALVFLSACRTAAGSLSPSEGALSPARFFLLAGARTVVASLWDIDDRGAEQLALRFHRRLRAGSAVLDALREAEIALWKEGESPSIWAAFEAVGAPL